MKSVTLPLLALAFAASASASPPEVYHYNVRGNGADGGLGSWNECGYTDSWVYLAEQVQHGQEGWSGHWGNFCQSSYDWCTNESTWFCADLSGADFKLKGAQGATVSASGVGYREVFLGCEFVEGTGEEMCEEWCDEAGNCESWCWIDEGWWDCHYDYVEVPYSIDLAWTPSGGVYRGIQTGSWKGKGEMYRYRNVGVQADCTISGTITVEGEPVSYDYSWGTSYTNASGGMSKWSWDF